MDPAEGCNDPVDYFQFLPEDAFILFGESDLHLDFNQFLAPDFERGSLDFEIVERDAQEASAHDVDVPSLTSTQPNDLITTSQETLPVLEHASASTPDIFQSPISTENMTTDTIDSAVPNKIKDSTAPATKRKFLTAFSATSGEEILLRSRKPFSQQKRQVVALNRTIGVCLQCKLGKVAVRITILV